jgi:TRAP-type C4-dicarboxylate transport system permease small subunit
VRLSLFYFFPPNHERLCNVIVWLIVISFLTFALAIASWLVVIERRHKSVLQRVLYKLLQRGSQDGDDRE